MAPATDARADLPRLTSLSHGAGCACKLGLVDLQEALHGLPVPDATDLLVGTDPGDDAAVWQRPDGSALVATTDFFTPLVDDPATWGRIAAANAASDVFAMGGEPLFALNLVGWPRDRGMGELTEVLRGGSEVASAGGWAVVGGHTIDAVEPFYGQAVVGEVDPEHLLTVDQARPGDALVLTKPIGTGIVMTAVKGSAVDAVAPGGALERAFTDAVASMTTLNAAAATAARTHHVRAATDVTGFGLTGHLHRMAAASGVAGTIEADAVPLLTGVTDLVADGHVPGGTRRNMAFARDHLQGEVTDHVLALLADAQTSGGLLLATDPAATEALLDDLRRSGHRPSLIGHLHEGPAGRLGVTT